MRVCQSRIFFLQRAHTFEPRIRSTNAAFWKVKMTREAHLRVSALTIAAKKGAAASSTAARRRRERGAAWRAPGRYKIALNLTPSPRRARVPAWCVVLPFVVPS